MPFFVSSACIVLSTALAFGLAQEPSPAAKPLVGTAWQLVRFQANDGTTHVPGQRRYTIEFRSGNKFGLSFDCNQGGGTWKTSGTNAIQFDGIFLTPVVCPPGPIHDRISRDWALIRTFAIKSGRLFLSLANDGGTYEFQPVPLSGK